MAEFPLLLEPEALAAALPASDGPALLIIEQAPLDTFLQHHIPGSVHLDFKQLQATAPAAPGELPSAQQLSQVLGALGLTPDTHVICSDHEGGGWAGRLIWMLDCLGHQHYSYLNGGLTAWLQAGLPVESGIARPQPSQYQADTSHQQSVSISQQQLLERLDSPDLAIWDARSAAEYSGEKAFSKRGGHIPGAVNLEWTQTMDRDRGLRLLPLATLRSRLQQLGIDDSKQVVTHCQSHHRSGLTYLVAKLLGLSVQAYPGSWSQWGNDPNTPISTVQPS